jgi:hypothetical protein
MGVEGVDSNFHTTTPFRGVGCGGEDTKGGSGVGMK